MKKLLLFILTVVSLETIAQKYGHMHDGLQSYDVTTYINDNSLATDKPFIRVKNASENILIKVDSIEGIDYKLDVDKQIKTVWGKIDLMPVKVVFQAPKSLDPYNNIVFITTYDIEGYEKNKYMYFDF